MPPNPPAGARPPRSRALVILDVVASIVLAFVGLTFLLVAVNWGGQFMAVAGGVGVALIVIAVLAFAIGVGMVVVNLIRRRFTFWWPLGAVIVMVIAIYACSAIVGAVVGA